MRAVFAHGHFDAAAADLAAVALAAYGVGLPAFALVRIFASTFYARHDTMTPARVTVTAIAVNIALKFIFVWGAHLGIAGVALGTAFGAWLNVGLLVWLGRRRGLLKIEPQFRRAMPPVIAAALVAGGGAWLGAHFAGQVAGHWRDLFALAGAGALGGAGYGAVVLALRRRLPLGKLSHR
jgi:putative peptidoglycan lipid II flippase